VRWPENCLRNSYATYAQTFRSSGDVARAMGDAESTVKRFYVRTLEPGVGKKWFNLSEKTFLDAPSRAWMFLSNASAEEPPPFISEDHHLCPSLRLFGFKPDRDALLRFRCALEQWRGHNRETHYAPPPGLERIVKPAAGIQVGTYLEGERRALFDLTKEKRMEGSSRNGRTASTDREAHLRSAQDQSTATTRIRSRRIYGRQRRCCLPYQQANVTLFPD
jgi:hypothetical protein